MKKSQFKIDITTVIAILLFSGMGYAQKFNPENYKTFYNFKTIKQADNSRLFEVSFITQNLEDKTDEMPVYKAEIKFLNILDDQEILLGSLPTGKDGKAQLVLKKEQKYLKNSDGFIKIVARFEDSELVEAQEEEVSFKDVFFELNLTDIDSVKTVSLKAYTLNDLGEEIPVDSTDVAFFVGGMLSKLKIEEGTIEQGTYEFEYTQDLPGDKNGNLTVFAMLEDDENYANVMQSKSAKFGTPIDVTNVTYNQLWSNAAPIWMYVVLSILLIGVWLNFLYTILNLIKIKKEEIKPIEE